MEIKNAIDKETVLSLNIDFSNILLYNVFSKILLSARIIDFYAVLYGKEVLCLISTQACLPICFPRE